MIWVRIRVEVALYIPVVGHLVKQTDKEQQEIDRLLLSPPN